MPPGVSSRGSYHSIMEFFRDMASPKLSTNVVKAVYGKMSSMKDCMEVARYLDESPQHLVRVPVKSSKDEREEARHRFRVSRKKVSHMLYAMVLELAIKVLAELDNNRECKHNHNIAKLFCELSESSKVDLKRIYDEQVSSLSSNEGKDQKGKSVRLGDLVVFQSLQEALQANEETMKKFKYDGKFKGKSSAMGSVIWDQKVFLALPASIQRRLPEALYEYVYGRVQRLGLG